MSQNNKKFQYKCEGKKCNWMMMTFVKDDIRVCPECGKPVKELKIIRLTEKL